MIDLTLTEMAFWAIGTAMTGVVLFEGISRWSARNAERRSLRRRVTCRLCLHVEEDEGREQPYICPNCGAANERGRNKSLG